MSRFVFSILFNSAYIEPALVTACELIKSSSAQVYLIYLQSENEDDRYAEKLIFGFKNRFDGDNLIKIIRLKNNLPKFQAFHFDNSIIYKCLIPNFIKNANFILNIDAGIIPGGRFSDFLHEINNICSSDLMLDWIIGGHCQKPELPEELFRLKHSTLYPAGGVLLFNTKNYYRVNWDKKYLDNYVKYLKILKYAEQELMCITSTDEEILNLPLASERYNIFLSMNWFESQNPSPNKSDIDKSIFYKCYGSFKPWKYFVLDPNKFVFTAIRDLLEKQFPLTGNPLIEKNRLLFPNNWSVGFLKAYDKLIAFNGNKIFENTRN